jgi:hypothetical protein
MAAACPWMNALRVPLLCDLWQSEIASRRTAITHKDLRLFYFSESIAATAFTASLAPTDTDTLCTV